MAERSASRRAATQGSARESSIERVTIGNINVPGYQNHVNADMYNAMQHALLTVLPGKAPGLTQAEMFSAVRPHLPEDLFPGGAKANWWAKTVQLDLEAQGIVVREQTKPLRWHRWIGR